MDSYLIEEELTFILALEINFPSRRVEGEAIQVQEFIRNWRNVIVLPLTCGVVV